MILLTIKQAADSIHMSEGYVRLAIRQGELGVYRLGRVRGIRIRPEDLEDFIARKFEGSLSSFEKERAAIAKMSTSLNQWVTSRDR